MSRVSSTAKRYAGPSYASHYSSYNSSLTPGLSTYSERDRLSTYRSQTSSVPSSGYSSSYLSSSANHTRNYITSSDLERGRTIPRSDILGSSSSSRRSESLSRTPVKSYGRSGLSGGSVYSGYNSYSSSSAHSSYLSSSPVASSFSLSRRKSVSQSDLSRDLASLGLNDTSSSVSTPSSSTNALRSYCVPRSEVDNGSSFRYSSLSRSSTQEGLSRSSIPEAFSSSSRRVLSSSTWDPSSNGVSDSSTRNSTNSKIARGLVGLKNLGNTCFMNSILQCLSNTHNLRDYCLNNSHRRDLNNNSRTNTALMEEFAQLMQKMWTSTSSDAVSPSEFKSQIQRYAPRFVGYNQQDAQEFLRFLLDGLHNEVNRVTIRPRGTMDDFDYLPDKEKGKKMWSKYLEREDSKIVDLFVGQLKSSLTCSQCGFCSTVFDPFWDLSLPIAKTGCSEVSLIDCVRLFTKEDMLDGDEKPTCYRCKARRRCTKKFTIQKFPKILVLHLKRFSEARRTSKLSTLVNFPMKDLDLREFASENSINAVYHLYAVSNHSGTTMGGHYTAFCLNPDSGEWYTFNDSRVTPMSSGHVHSSDAYVLFYEYDDTGLYSHLTGVPKALLPGIGGKKILDFWWEMVNMRQLFSEVYMVTNADKYKHYERWATANDFPVENVVNDGSTTLEDCLGAVADLELVIRSRKLQDDIMVIAGDMLCADLNFDIAQVIRFFRSKPGELIIYYELEESEKSSSRGIVEVCPDTHRIKQFLEKPVEGRTPSRLATVVFYCIQRGTLSYMADYLNLQPHAKDRGFGRFWEWLINEKQIDVFGMKLPTGFQLIGQVGLSDYTKWLTHYSKKQLNNPTKPVTYRSYARVGLMGNPSDGFNGKTIAMSISNFWAEVTLVESQTLVLLPHPLNDPTEFGSLQDLFCISKKEGYLGGLRLLQATCKKFYQFCSKQGGSASDSALLSMAMLAGLSTDHRIALTKQNFTLKYDTNIPRQVGLAGSSAIVSATLKCLMKFYNITDNDLPKPIRANFILMVETDELFITAGLQDRVVQVHEGLVYMNFSKELMDKQGYGNYVSMDMSELPQFWLAYLSDPSDSGRIHSNIRQRWLSGEPLVVEAMKTFADLTDQARAAIQDKDWSCLEQLMDKNFELRRSVYTDACLGPGNMKMVHLARLFGSAAKLPGSGGAVVGLCLDQAKLVEMKQAFQDAGCVFCLISPYNPSSGQN